MMTARLSAQIGLVLLLCVCIEAEYMSYKDPKQPLDVRIEDLIRRMTLEEKIGQMTMIDRKVASADIVKDYFIGALLSGGGSVPAPKASAETWINMVNEFQIGALSTRLGIPLFYGIDAVHGHNTVYNATVFPHNVGLGVTRDPELVKKIGAATALEVRATGIPYTFAPCIAVCRDPRWGRCFESYSEDHEIVRAMTEIIPGLQGDLPPDYPSDFPYVGGRTKVAACAKHFVGDGGTTDGINESNTIIDWDGLLSIHMPAYLDSIRKGIVISDSQGIDKITTPPHDNYTYSVEASINAGIDMVSENVYHIISLCGYALKDIFLVPENFMELIDTLALLVKKNVISMTRIDDAVERILRVKFIMGLFENSMADFTLVNQLGSQEHRELAREAVRRSLVLLKNGENGDVPLIPLPKKAKKILVAGSHANDIGTTILAAVKNAIDPQTEVVHHENPGKEFMNSNGFSYAIVAVGELPYSETVGDSMNLTIARPGYDTITNVCQAIKSVVIIISGRPVVIQPYLPLIDALVAAWLPGTEGQGVADVLFGDYGFTGKLARTWFRTVDQLPMNVGDPHYDPLFPFGFGLTTTPRDMKESQ
ncbi:UNVERIFIED_CONTAM: Beta-glucosidase BoGH3B [Sesamum calycinum]|uniref:Beta-glucosidase BoGH3B n=1 Tax=Sesamum calycinum TaxID=2727403 RepID=A0AAW2SBM3_9LAMI